MMNGAKKVIALVALAMTAASTTEAQQQNSDSAQVRRRVVRAQERFETVRRNNLPTRNAGRGGDCDARIGRFCQWNSEDDTIGVIELRATTKARSNLLAILDSAALKSPRDGWITGQRIRYLLETRNDTAAARVANECRAAEWWCAALLGLAYQQSWSGIASDSAFAHALRTMPAAERCRWSDMTPLLDPPLRKKIGKVGCGRNEQLAERLWWIADPFWGFVGNDRRTEHYARHTMAKILEPARLAYNLSWSSDLREMIVRYGWARYWTRGPGTLHEPAGGAISGHEATPNYHFIPVSLRTDSVPVPSFDLDLKASAERYAPVMARNLFEINPQIATFRRGDSSLVVAAYDVTGRKELDSTSASASIVIARDELSPAYIGGTSGQRGAMSVMVDTRPQIMSVEVVNAASKRGAARRRSLLDLSPIASGQVSMSDVLLFAPQDNEVSDLDTAMRSAFGETTVGRNKIGLYWETYGLARTDSAMPVSLTLTRVSQGTLRRIGESVGLSSKFEPLSIRWSQMMSVGSLTARSVVLDLSLIPRGKYSLRVETGEPGKPIASTSRIVDVR